MAAGLSIIDMDLTNGYCSVPRYGSILLRSVYESAASFISGLVLTTALRQGLELPPRLDLEPDEGRGFRPKAIKVVKLQQGIQ